MFKRLVLVLLLFISLSAQAGELDKLIEANEKLFLYLYTQDCSYCVKFNPIYNKMVKKYKGKCNFIKIDANSKQGSFLMYETQANYVPNVVIIDAKKRRLAKLVPNCLLEEACMDRVLKSFVN